MRELYTLHFSCGHKNTDWVNEISLTVRTGHRRLLFLPQTSQETITSMCFEFYLMIGRAERRVGKSTWLKKLSWESSSNAYIAN